MNDAMRELGRRAIAAGFEWAPGCKSLGPWSCRVLLVKPSHNLAWLESAFDWPFAESAVNPADVPDFSDPATLGCLLAQVRERWGETDIYCRENHSRHRTGTHEALFGLLFIGRGDSEAAALVAALEAAPKVAP